MPDTRDKRASAMNLRMPFRRDWPLADGAIDQGDRQHAALMYSGILAEALATPTIPTYDPNTRVRPGYAPLSFPPPRFPPAYVKTR
jgi:hypothetical protein